MLDEGVWPVNEYTEGLPVPSGTVAWAMLDTEHENCSISIVDMKDIRYWVGKVLTPEQAVEKKPEPKHSVTEKMKFLQEQGKKQPEQKSPQHKKQNIPRKVKSAI